MALAKEIRYLFLAHGINVAIPLLLIPLLAHRLGIDEFGRFVILTGSSVYLAYAIELGFNNVAIERFSRGTNEEKRRVFAAVLIIKCALLLIVFPTGIALYANLLETWGWERGTAWFCMLPVVTCLIYPAWFFIVEKKQKINFYVQMVTKLLLLIGVIVLVSDSSDAVVAVIIYSSATFIASIVFCQHWFGFVDRKNLPDIRYLIEFASAGAKASGLAVRDAWSANGLAPLLGLLLHSQQLANFALAEKMIRTLATPASSFGSILLANHVKFRKFYKDRLTTYLPLALMIAVAAYALIAVAILMAMQNYMQHFYEVALLFVIMLASVPFIYANYTLLNIIYIQQQRYKSLTFSIIIQCAFAFTLAAWFAHAERWLFAAGSVVCVEVVAFGCAVYISRRRRSLSDNTFVRTDG